MSSFEQLGPKTNWLPAWSLPALLASCAIMLLYVSIVNIGTHSHCNMLEKRTALLYLTQGRCDAATSVKTTICFSESFKNHQNCFCQLAFDTSFCQTKILLVLNTIWSICHEKQTRKKNITKVCITVLLTLVMADWCKCWSSSTPAGVTLRLFTWWVRTCVCARPAAVTAARVKKKDTLRLETKAEGWRR